jgi:hypothetical protein
VVVAILDDHGRDRFGQAFRVAGSLEAEAGAVLEQDRGERAVLKEGRDDETGWPTSESARDDEGWAWPAAVLSGSVVDGEGVCVPASSDPPLLQAAADDRQCADREQCCPESFLHGAPSPSSKRH